MNKWALRLMGVLILGLLAILVYDSWFRPTVPDALQDGISLQVDGQDQTNDSSAQGLGADEGTGQGQGQGQGQGGDVTIPPAPPIQLTSLEDQNAPAVLTNPETQPQPVQSTQPISTEESAGQQPSVEQSSAQASPATAQENINQGASWIQVGSFADNENAQKMVAQMQDRNWPTDTEVANVNGKSYHRVFVGPLSASDVPDYLNILNEMGINAREVTR